MHTIFHRAHNSFANGLAKIKPDWDDKMLYQNERKILIGVWQNIVFGEYLPLIIGQPAIENYKIDVTDTYNEKTDATTTNEGGIAFRFGHSTVSRLIALQDEDYSLSMPPETFKDHYFLTKLYHIFDGRGREDVFRWTVDSACQKMDRGRDHGFPGYNAYRRYCGHDPARDFSTMRGGLVNMDSDVASLLQKVYR
ncbi:hypothetical protein DPMN_058938 [Dreissena polymorpha]|uniref:Peroxidase n=1 Tax=Dreissena polymorpha TaxID=45954 RepID=A0A9D4C350_DREPO|nr:hypothetical protein DPMN_058938 [Dreissena polymorpha]